MKTWLVTGGAGFIGSNFILRLASLAQNKSFEPIKIINLDKLTYAGNPENLKSLQKNSHYTFIRGDIGNTALVTELLEKYQPQAILNFAAESHVDRSIEGPDAFIQTNVVGTFHLLEAAKNYWKKLSQNEQKEFRFLHISTDEVYGSLESHESPFTESFPYQPNSPYAASKASSDHLVRAYYHTYGLPTLISNCSNNYGPYQFPEKLIPLAILNAMEGKSIPLYGDGLNIRDWLYVEDHVRALQIILEKGEPGEKYNVGGKQEKTNLEIVKTLCHLLDELLPQSTHLPHQKLMTFVKDRPGHDRRYAINSSKIEKDLGWYPLENFETGIKKTMLWYLENTEWINSIRTNVYQDWIHKNYAQR